METIVSLLYGEDAFLELRLENKSEGSATQPGRTRALRYSLALLSQLQAMRKPRTAKTYETLLRHCVHVGKPDMAASVFAGLVEEWILEGRVAEVGDGSLFHEGGVPKQNHPSLSEQAKEEQPDDDDRRKMKKIVDSWFEGVRTWRLPGEAMAPLEKLEFWHPKALRLHEKMRNFPFPSPTSPPSLVPAPSASLLDIVICSLTYEPACSDPRTDRAGNLRQPEIMIQNRPYRRSARALAILANTILSRTLPVTALRPLFKAMRRLSLQVPVYPKNFDWKGIDPDRRSEFSAGTHVHSALISLLWSPPSLNSPAAVWSSYRLPPLSLQSTRTLLRYALSVFPSSNAVKRFLKHIKQAFGIGVITKVVLGPSRSQEKGWKSFFQVNKIDEKLKILEEREAEIEIPEPPVTDEDVIFRLKLAREEGRAEVNNLIYKAFPFLNTYGYKALPLDADYATLHREQHRRTRLVQSALSRSSWTFVAGITALHSIGNTPLAERLYLLALRAEEDAQKGFELDKAKAWYLPIEGHLAMLKLYAEEYRESARRIQLRARGFDIAGLPSRPFQGLKRETGKGAIGLGSHTSRGRSAWQSASFVLSQVLNTASEPRSSPKDVEQYKRNVSAFEWSNTRPPMPNAELLEIIADLIHLETEAWLNESSKSLEPANRIWRLILRVEAAIKRYQLKPPVTLARDSSRVKERMVELRQRL
jgi:hypothetical protein